MLQTIMKQNCFQYNDKFFQPEKGIAMGSSTWYGCGLGRCQRHC